MRSFIWCCIGLVVGFALGFKAEHIYVYFAHPNYCPIPVSVRALEGCEDAIKVAREDMNYAEMRHWQCEDEKDNLLRTNATLMMTIDCMLRPGDCRSPSAEEEDGTGTLDR